MKYIPGLNGLRAFAVIFVIFYHWGLPPGLLFFKYILPDGRFGVDLFFVISGFLISSILFLENKKHPIDANKRKILINFYIRRFLRIFPIYYLTILALYLVNFPYFKPNVIYYLTYTENFNEYFHTNPDSFAHAWSLSVEEQFYLLWPFVILFTRSSKLIYILLFFIFIGPAFALGQVYFLKSSFNKYILTPTCFDSFGIGAILGHFYCNDKLSKCKKWIKILLPLSIVLFFYWKFAENGGHFQYFRRFFNSIIAAALILFCLSDSFNKTKVLLDNKLVNQLGLISYGIYLYHYPIMFLLPFSDNRLVDYSLKTSLLLFLAFASYYLIERPFLKLKRTYR